VCFTVSGTISLFSFSLSFLSFFLFSFVYRYRLFLSFLGLGKKKNFPIWAQLPTQLQRSSDVGIVGPKKREEKELGVRACLLNT
jgi:hypothetical protein